LPKVRPLETRYDPKRVEDEVKRFWEEERIYDRAREALSSGPKFYFLDGPPYPSAEEPHPGTCWNKFIKDSVIRFRRLLGYNVNDRPGWDTHGLPIEVMVEKSLGIKSKREIERRGIASFVETCRDTALRNMRKMEARFWDLGVSLNWGDPYVTLSDDYVESIWWGIKKIWEQGRLQRGPMVVHWCPRCETVLSDYETSEYRDLVDPSIYVRFRLKDGSGYILIWTTTPWTLPANVAVMVHPEASYVRVRAGGDVYILARERLNAVADEVGWEDYEVLEEFPGAELEGLEYEHPLRDLVTALSNLEGAHRVVLSSEYVSMEEGTGCVHAAPGHGQEDFEVVHERYGMPVLSFVDDRGVYTEEAGKYAGLFVRDANPVIVEDLRERGALVYEGRISHRYPICWRCKTPLILRTTPQWFIRLRDLKEELIEEARKVMWVPAWAGEKRMVNWLSDLRDWVISRQRYWGTPLPIWICDSCGKVVVVGSREELEELSGTAPRELHRPWIDEVSWPCECGGTFRRVPDVLDVWFDSGASFYASLGYPKRAQEALRWMPADFITEGHDQIRGWFFSLLRIGYLLFGSAPYTTVLMHGFMLDERGMEMHKSLGNFVPPADIVKRVGRDPFRIFVLSKVPWKDVRFSWRELENFRRRLSIVWSVHAFVGLYFRDIELEPTELDPLDRWLLSRAASTAKRVAEAMERYHIHEAVEAVLSFYVEDVSHTYIPVIRRELRLGPPEKKKARGWTLYSALRHVLPMLSLFAPFIAEKIWTSSLAQEGDPPSVNMLRYSPRDEWIDKELEELMEVARSAITTALSVRAKAGVKRRLPVREVVVVPLSGRCRRAVKLFAEAIRSHVNARSVRVSESRPEGDGWGSLQFSDGEVFLSLEIGPEEVAIWLAREVARRIQETRKEMGLSVGVEVVEVFLRADDEVRRAVSRLAEEVMAEVDASKITFIEGEPPEGCHGREWEIDGRRVGIWVRRV